MLNSLLSLLGLTKTSSASTSKDPDAGFRVEFYPATQVYYVLYYGYYLKTDYQTGIVKQLEYKDWLHHAQMCRTEVDAWKLVDLFKEQQLKENVKVLRRG